MASNPKDWKLSHWASGYEQIEGSDLAGVVEAVGEGVTEFQVRDKVRLESAWKLVLLSATINLVYYDRWLLSLRCVIPEEEPTRSIR